MRTKTCSWTSCLITSAVLVLLVFLFGCASSHHSSSAAPIFDKLIVPGERIGPISLGMMQADVLKILGVPPKSSIHTDGHSRYYYADLTVWISRDSRVFRIGTDSPEYATADGIRVGMTEPEVRAKKGNPTRMEDYNVSVIYNYKPKLEIGIKRSTDNRITFIYFIGIDD